MNRLTIPAALLLGALMSACSGSTTDTNDPVPVVQASTQQGGADQTEPSVQRGLGHPESEISSPAQITPVSREFARRMRMPDRELLDELELPMDELLGKLPSVAGTDTILGKDSFMFSSGNVSNVGNAKRLAASNKTAWAMYRFQGYSFHKDPGVIKVTTAGQSFGGSSSGYVLAIANYNTGRWQMLVSSNSTAPLAKTLLMSDDFRSPGSNVYVAVILPKGQQMDLTQLELSYEEVDWINVKVDDIAGWTPSLAFLPNGNIFLAYADFLAGEPLAAVLDRSLDPGIPSNWSVGDMNSLGKGVGLGQDVCLGPTGQPRISLAYTAIASSEANTLMGYTAYYDEGESNEAGFWNYEFGLPAPGISELAVSTSTDYNSAGGKYGYTVHFQPDGAMRYRQFILNESDPQETISPSGGLTNPGYWFPRIRFAPGDSLIYFANNGGFLTQESSPNVLTDIYEDVNSSDVGSLSINPSIGSGDETFGFVYRNAISTNSPGDGVETLRYVPLLANFNLTTGGIQPVDTMPASADNFLADFNQVEFMPDGSPAIAYTRDEAGKIDIWYAWWDGNAWQREKVSNQAINKYDDSLRIWLDMDIDQNGIAGIIWNHATADDASSLMFAIRGS
jgi:hypothetical protein